MHLTPLNLQLIGHELAIAWNDQTESYLPLEALRRHCPCAGCNGEPELVGETPVPEVSYTEASFRLRNYQIMGGYAFAPTWDDGHNTGLYTFQFLRELSTLFAQEKGAGPSTLANEG